MASDSVTRIGCFLSIQTMMPRHAPTESPVNLSMALNASLFNNSSQPDIPSLALAAPNLDKGATDQETSEVGVLFLYLLVVGAFFLFILYVASVPRWCYVRDYGRCCCDTCAPHRFEPHVSLFCTWPVVVPRWSRTMHHPLTM
jgi:hypothetical protein